MPATTTTIIDFMRTLFSVVLWALVFLLILVAVDQLLVRVPATLPIHVAAAEFYRDLRGRVIDLVKGGKSPSAPPAAPVKPPPPVKSPKGPGKGIEGIIEQRQARPPAAPSAGQPVPRYVYADSRGEIHFADTLAEVPEEYREKVKVLGE